MSGLWGAGGPLEEFLTNRGITTLFFAATLSDAHSKGFDCILLTDVCGTASAQNSIDATISNTEQMWGFISSTEKLIGSKEAQPRPIEEPPQAAE
ncbi:uncharacterized protein EI90DRAFT_3031852 [Cantharellus anzutake]|uniref:uncharacterized protein n=1 Tax=Cantharellus anzutake TaxID=1750568 RepID=UPI0019063086|nr:uncharacterized protein EI90DRAFT_3031852 [Cantharellus anzutake]KAF8342010.1 hypothetical protein EI90DRAFT_3031852 [Cantharellus anzutake]